MPIQDELWIDVMNVERKTGTTENPCSQPWDFLQRNTRGSSSSDYNYLLVLIDICGLEDHPIKPLRLSEAISQHLSPWHLATIWQPYSIWSPYPRERNWRTPRVRIKRPLNVSFQQNGRKSSDDVLISSNENLNPLSHIPVNQPNSNSKNQNRASHTSPPSS
jgi:hypothetical protein